MRDPRSIIHTIRSHETHRLTAVLVSHFLLDLQETNQRALRVRSSGAPSNEFSTGTMEWATPRFASRIVGSLGSTLAYPTVDEDKGASASAEGLADEDTMELERAPSRPPRSAAGAPPQTHEQPQKPEMGVV